MSEKSSLKINVMHDITVKLGQILHAISDHGNVFTSKFITYFGAGGSAAGVTTLLAEGVRKNQEKGVYLEPEFLWFTLTEWGSVVGIAGGLSLIIKLIVDWYYRRKQDKREQEVHDRKYGL